ncbi:MAG: SAM-dependent methyltransferase, partial [Pseudomonadales bacterium]
MVTRELRPPLLGISLISGASLALEVLLLQIFSVVEWHHFAYMVISVALLGFGASGTFVYVTQSFQLPRYRRLFLVYTMIFALLVPVTFVLVQRVPYNSLEFLWDRTQWFYLLLVYLLLALPFFVAGTCVCLSLRRFEDQAGTVYAADLFGAGLGATAVVFAMFVLPPDVLMRIVAGTALLATVAAWARFARPLEPWMLVLPLIASALVFVPAPWLRLEMSPYKAERQQLELLGSERIATRWSPLGVVSVLTPGEVALRRAPGMSLASDATIPPQLALFANGHGPDAVSQWDGDEEALRYLGELTSAVPYQILDRRAAALIIGASGTDPILQAVFHGVSSIDVVELNSSLVDLLTSTVADRWTFDELEPRVRFHIGEARSWLRRSDRRYDLIVVPLTGSRTSASPGLHGMMENYLLTVEGLSELLRRLSPDGVLAISEWLAAPPRATLRLIDTAGVALGESGVDVPADHVAMVRGWQTVTVLISRRRLDARAMDEIRDFAASRRFDLAVGPGVGPETSNRYHILADDYFHQAAQSLLGEDRSAFLDSYKFDVRATRDNRPYFSNFFKWSSLEEILALRTVGGAALLEWGYPILVLTFLQALGAGLIFIVLPLVRVRRREGRFSPIALYFAAIGFGFMFVEIGFIQKFVLLLGHPLYSTPLVLASFLLFAGIGSRASERLSLQKIHWP